MTSFVLFAIHAEGEVMDVFVKTAITMSDSYTVR